ncbi:MAG: hypothetical protein PHT79_11900 [Syntrophomonadaceae bacterium]|nr:hypothetical protein [Syntrophomonadaceae bacterium]MDD3890312.1 hypothetical protein [Syntrophomonadaceae bacterium]MDD4550447.1 hypothetical protein [Syntrophomonadaceae bacterium]
MIDTHIHILPGLDDGAKDIKHSLEMARMAVQDGITSVVATPHVLTGAYDNSKENILSAVKDLNQLLKAEKIPLKILPGAEYYLEHDLPQRLAEGKLLTINNTGYLLIELPAAFVPDYSDQIFYELQLQGVIPIIAHAERNHELSLKSDLLEKFIARGALVQITAGSITGLFGKETKKVACNLLSKGLAHLIVSDAHSCHRRVPVLSKARDEAEVNFGTDYARSLVDENPNAIITGDLLKPKKPHQSSWIKFKNCLGL